MELKYEIALYICGAVALVYIVLTFISLHRRRKYKGGSKVVVPDYLKNLPYYKFKVRSYKVMKFLLSLSIISSILLSGFLMARPYKTETTTIENYNRDIIICMDISTTVDELNEVLVDKLIDVVEDLEGQTQQGLCQRSLAIKDIEGVALHNVCLAVIGRMQNAADGSLQRQRKQT